jgi:uncharacterized protein (DUF924 family)
MAERGNLMRDVQEVLDFWFSEDAEKLWFASTPAFDQEIRQRFAVRFAQAASGELRSWEESPEGCVALCVLLDQMPRNMFRGSPRAFATDAKALAIAERAVSQRFDRGLPPDQKQFLYLPFVHSEDIANQLRALALCEAAGLREGLEHVIGRVALIRRFGRFPHRNAMLGRTSTPEELKFLAQHPNGYGQRAPYPSDGAAARARTPSQSASAQGVGDLSGAGPGL